VVHRARGSVQRAGVEPPELEAGGLRSRIVGSAPDEFLEKERRPRKTPLRHGGLGVAVERHRIAAAREHPGSR
jgi:hypothetical protein